jgi:oxygen-independent coproporphyrinogen III oxidase
MGAVTLDLLKKYDVAIPRYTSYPTVPYWDFSGLSVTDWKREVGETFHREDGALSLYIHLPFCEQLCTFCACNKRITVNHAVEAPYVETVLAEWAMYRQLFGKTPKIAEIHLGGGTPTFFSPDQLDRLISGILEGAEVPDDHEFSIEVHPNYTKEAHLETLARLGFNRISMGVQDFDPLVQFTINRIQSYEQTKEVVEWSRKHGFNSVNIDLVYGLPHQTLDSIEMTIEHINKLMPERIAYYSYAHVPWKSKGQRRYTEADLPQAEDKMEMYRRGSEWLQASGFVPIGMDHFALPGDGLLKAAKAGTLHRNFMGYTTTQNKLIVALGASSIGDSWTAFAQNEKVVEAYQERVHAGEFPLVNGHLLTEEDLVIRQHILDLMCRGETKVDMDRLDPAFVEWMEGQYGQLASDGLVEWENGTIKVMERGQIFIRNISAALDVRLWRQGKGPQVFSRAI